MHEKVQQLQIKIAEGKLKDDLISSKDTHIKDLEKFRDEQKLGHDNYVKELLNTISLLKTTNHGLQQNVELVHSELVQLKTELKSCQLDLNACRDQLRI